MPFKTAVSSPQAVDELDLAKLPGSLFSVLAGVTNEFSLAGSGLPLSAFRFLNDRDYGHFYHVADAGVDTTYLLNYWVLVIPNIVIA